TWPRQGGLKMETAPKIAEIDFASKMGWEYYTIDAKWTGFDRINDPRQDLTRSAEKLDLDAVLAHAKKKNVGVFLWAYWSVLESNGVERVFQNLSSRGVKGLKIDFMDRQDQEMVNWYEKVVRLAAKYKLLINFHGAYHPTGMNRTWPNQITREAVAGNECHRYGWRITPELVAGLPFTRFLIGPADYTPGSFNNVLPHQFAPVNLMKDVGDRTTQEVGTRAHALALCVAYDSPLMTLCDTPGIYEGQMGLDALKNLPAAWDDTKCLGGEIGEWYSVARTAPDGRRYFAVISAKSRTVNQKFTFLGPGLWRMTLYADDMKKSRKDARVVRVVKRTVNASNSLTLDIAPIGGAVAVFEPAAPAPCDVPSLKKTFNGEKVSTVKMWEKVRAPELLEEFTMQEYGRRPVERPQSLVFEAVEPDVEMMEGKALRKRIRATYAGKYGKASFEFTAFIPKGRKNVPSFLLICNRPPAENIDPSRKKKSGFWPAEEIVGRGYAAIAFWNGDIAPDRNVGNREGVFACFENPERGRAPHLWGTLSAWAWGASRVMDWIETEPLLDAKRVAVVGHSRGGKTALVTGVYDKRFAMVCSNNSGCSGAKLNHIDLPKSEHLADIVRNFPYWFCGNYVRHVNAEREWKVDQHQFIALLAPRLVCIASATEDVWAGPEGEYYSGILASPAWRLYGKKGLVSNGFPPPEKPLQEGCISYHLRTGKHNLTPYDWSVFMNFADKHGWNK
ncbi:MAG: glycoside hydrolase family 97 catalytic domain-containing protein, partial [Kiritimatiellae bacterium]|nr:glycoside hydrolase family 97 catalytic domain-containing protein [Kiritimatiellia bacterium]